MALRDAFSRFLRGRAESRRTDDDSDGSRATALGDVADDIDSDDDAELVVLIERLQGYYVPETDEFVPTAVAVEIIEGFDGDDTKDLVRALGDAAQTSEDQDSSQGTGDRNT